DVCSSDLVPRARARPVAFRCCHAQPGGPMPEGEASRAGELTGLLRAVREGDRDALGRLVPLVYDDLRRLARRQLRREAGPRTLQATALVHEAFIKLSAGAALAARDRTHFLAIAARATIGRAHV